MNWLDIQVMLLACITACACVIPGIFLVLRGVALISDAISHAVLLGIVLLFLVIQDLHSPLLLLGASISGVLTVVFTEWIIATHCLKKDAAIGLIYPLFFSIGVLLISCFARNAHLDLDMIFLGDLAYAPFNRAIIAGIDFGPSAFIIMSIILGINILFITLFYKEITSSIFDPLFAHLNGMQPLIFYYILMILTSITTVGAFDVVGAIVVIALMITPPATALLLSSYLPHIISISISISIIASLLGYCIATLFDVSIAGSIATMSGVCFMVVLLFSPENGLFTHFLWKSTQRMQLLQRILFSYLKTTKKISIHLAANQLGWSYEQTKIVLLSLQKKFPDILLCDQTIIMLNDYVDFPEH